MKSNLKVLIKGAGEMATGVAWSLYQSHLHVLMTEIPLPLAVRRGVAFCEAVHEGRKTVEGVEAVLIDHANEADEAWANSKIPLMVDPFLEGMSITRPDVLIEATLAKKNTGITINDAPLVIALGPGYEAGRDAHLVVETNRGHHLGRLYTSGYAQANTGVPGNISGMSAERVLRAPADGVFDAKLVLGDLVEARQVVAMVAGEPVVAGIAGILRGLIRSGTQVSRGLKVGDVDPRGDKSYVDTISEKARAIGGSVLEGICRKWNF
jgi:xanthine dehydrogenase accessory factor